MLTEAKQSLEAVAAQIQLQPVCSVGGSCRKSLHYQLRWKLWALKCPSSLLTSKTLTQDARVYWGRMCGALCNLSTGEAEARSPGQGQPEHTGRQFKYIMHSLPAAHFVFHIFGELGFSKVKFFLIIQDLRL